MLYAPVPTRRRRATLQYVSFGSCSVRAMPHSYEEIRSIALDILAERESVQYPPVQYEHIKLGIAEVFARREGRQREALPPQLDRSDSEIYLEVFWELFRQGIITLGLHDSNREFPHCRLSEFGRRLLQNGQGYFFHDVTSYANLIQHEIPNIDPVTLVYLQEAMQAFKAGCILSASVMLGVATEHTFLLMLETVEASPRHGPTYRRVFRERLLLSKANCFKSILDSNVGGLSTEIREDLDTHFAGILAIIRTFRNQSGHPTGQIISREQAYVLLNLFIPYGKKLYQLREYFAQP